MGMYFHVDSMGYFSAELTNTGVKQLRNGFPNFLQTVQDGPSSLQFKAYARVSGSTTMGQESPLTDLLSADFTVNFVDFTQTEQCSGVTLRLNDVGADGTIRDDEYEFTV